MKKLIGSELIKTAIFISGTGTNLKNLILFSKKNISPISIDLIISNNKNAKGLIYSNKYNIQKKIINFNNNFVADQKILNLLNERKIKLICLAGFMKIISKNFLKKFNGTVINIHPSLLPKYKGLNTHKRVIKNKEKFTGCSVHYVTEKLDAGKIIIQKKIKIKANDTEITLSKKVLKMEHKIYPIGILKAIDQSLK